MKLAHLTRIALILFPCVYSHALVSRVPSWSFGFLIHTHTKGEMIASQGTIKAEEDEPGTLVRCPVCSVGLIHRGLLFHTQVSQQVLFDLISPRA